VVGEFYGTQYQSGSLSLINVGMAFQSKDFDFPLRHMLKDYVNCLLEGYVPWLAPQVAKYA